MCTDLNSSRSLQHGRTKPCRGSCYPSWPHLNVHPCKDCHASNCSLGHSSPHSPLSLRSHPSLPPLPHLAPLVHALPRYLCRRFAFNRIQSSLSSGATPSIG